MQLIRKITDSDITGGTAPEYMDVISRYAARGVLVDGMSNVAMMYMSKKDLYKLPGGGIEENETIENAFLREIKEEAGFEAIIIRELGYIEEHKKQNDFMQFSYCFIAKIQNEAHNVKLSENEIQLGMMVKWMTLERALEVMNHSMVTCHDYSSKFMILRDKLILEKAVTLL